MYNLSIEQKTKVREIKKFKDKIKYLRINCVNMGPIAFAKELGISYRHLWSFEKEDHPQMKTIVRYMNYFNLDYESLKPQGTKKRGNR